MGYKIWKGYIKQFLCLLEFEDSSKSSSLQEQIDIEQLDTWNEGDRIPIFIGEVDWRVKLRNELLNSIKVNECNEENFKEFLEHLIKMEEDFLAN